MRFRNQGCGAPRRWGQEGGTDQKEGPPRLGRGGRLGQRSLSGLTAGQVSNEPSHHGQPSCGTVFCTAASQLDRKALMSLELVAPSQSKSALTGPPPTA